jgi:hypothetical protein
MATEPEAGTHVKTTKALIGREADQAAACTDRKPSANESNHWATHERERSIVNNKEASDWE